MAKINTTPLETRLDLLRFNTRIIERSRVAAKFITNTFPPITSSFPGFKWELTPNLTLILRGGNYSPVYRTWGSAAIDMGDDCISYIRSGDATNAYKTGRLAARYACRWLAGDRSYWPTS